MKTKNSLNCLDHSKIEAPESPYHQTPSCCPETPAMQVTLGQKPLGQAMRPGTTTWRGGIDVFRARFNKISLCPKH
jgi:hypothetical protein